MSSKYEREIEEILRNTHMDDGRPSVKDRLRAMNRRPPRRAATALRVGPELWLGLGLVLAFVAATIRWIIQVTDPTKPWEEWLIGGLATLGFLLIAFTIIGGWIAARRGSSQSWRGSPLTGGRGPGPRPFADPRTLWRLLKLRLRHRQGRL